jgi:hypothetical protein
LFQFEELDEEELERITLLLREIKKEVNEMRVVGNK